MSNFILVSPQSFDAATLQGDKNQVPSLPTTNVQRTQPGEVHRQQSTISTYEIDYGAAVNNKFFALLYTNLSDTATWRLSAGTDTFYLNYNSGIMNCFSVAPPAMWDRRHAIKVLGAAQNYRYWKIQVFDSSSADGYVQIGRIYTAPDTDGLYWSPSINMAYGWDVGYQDRSTSITTKGGATYYNRKSKRRIVNLTINYLDIDEMHNNASSIDHIRGAAKDVLFIGDPDNADRLMDWTVYGTLQPGPVVYQLNGYVTRTFQIIEMELP